MKIRNNIKKIALFCTLALLSVCAVAVIDAQPADAADEESVLFDMGNGSTLWAKAESGETIDEVLENTSKANGMEYASSSNIITLNGLTQTTIGGTSSGGSLSNPGTTGKTVTSKWIAFVWNAENDKWIKISDLNSEYTGGSLAIGFYPSDKTPVETPDYRSSWTMMRGNAQQTGEQETTEPSGEAELKWNDEKRGVGVYTTALSVQGHIFVKYGAYTHSTDASVVCYTLEGDPVWEFSYPVKSLFYETACPVIVGDYIYIPATHGYIFKMPWADGPGTGNQNVTTFNGVSYKFLDFKDLKGAIPENTADLTGMPYAAGPGGLVYDSGAIYFTSSNGMIYCFDLNLNLIWSQQMGGSSYYLSQTVCDDYLFAGALNGTLYAVDKKSGAIIDQEKVYTRTIAGKEYGSVQAVSVLKEGDTYVLMFGISDGRGMSSMVGGLGIYSFDGEVLTKKKLMLDEFGMVTNYLLPVENDTFKGVYFTASNGLFRVDTNGQYKLLNETFTTVRAPIVLVNGDSMYIQSYTPNKPWVIVATDGKIVSSFSAKTNVMNYSMAPMLIIDGWVFSGNDSGLNVIYGEFPGYIEPGMGGSPLIVLIGEILLVIAAVLLIIYAVMRYVKKIEKPFNHIANRVKHYISGDDLKHNKRSKNRLQVVMLIGISLTLAVFIICLCVGHEAVLSLGEMFSALVSSITHGGVDPSNINEIRVFESRLPRTLAALGVGIGLSVAGSMYQAIIRNPLVDPYIMGVSAGAGTAAVAVIAFDFTFFGLFSPHSIYLTAFTAMIGGLIAFAATMFIAERAGGSSVTYVLAGVVVGFAFSAVQTLMLSMAGQDVGNALTWLFGSFANVSWSEVGLILIPGIALALVPFLWAKEFNLVLLGEDQAQQMGLNVKRFNRTMLILASVLASLCVAFVGIIGFVGLVVPHLCRMLMGGDHRLVLPASMAFGGALMMLADLASRTLYLGQELPVGAITTIIGVPVFAYLLIKRGKMYDG